MLQKLGCHLGGERGDTQVFAHIMYEQLPYKKTNYRLARKRGEPGEEEGESMSVGGVVGGSSWVGAVVCGAGSECIGRAGSGCVGLN